MATKTGKHGDTEVPCCPLCKTLIRPGDDAELVGEVGEGNARLVCSTCSGKKSENAQLSQFL